jgi:general stress protein 26
MQTTTPSKLNDAERAKIVSFLSKHPVGVLATVDPQGDPHASALYFSVDKSLHITFTTKQDTHKYKNISKHSTVVLVVFEAESQTTVEITGKAVEVTDPEEQQAIYKGTLHAAAQTGEDIVPPIAKIPAGKYVGFTIEIEDISLSEYGWGGNFANAMKHVHDEAGTSDPA